VSHRVELYEKETARLLLAFYNEPYILHDDPERLVTLAEIAKYHAALPTLSRTLDGALSRSPDTVSSLCENDNAWWLLETAVQLRSANLFRECLILTLGP
jgi:hypothetical protein